MSDSFEAGGANTKHSQPGSSHKKQLDVDAAILKARSECLSFSTLMYKKLPKDLRDLVYSYLCLEDRQIPVGPYYHFRTYEPLRQDGLLPSEHQYFPRHGDLQTILPDGKIRTDHDIYPQDDFIMPSNHIFDPSLMGVEVALEVLKKYYESNSFSVCNIEGGLDSLCTYTKVDSQRSNLDFAPITRIRNLQIRIKYEHFNGEFSSEEQPLGSRLREFAEKENFLQYTVDSLRKFRSEMQKSTPHELELEIVLMSDLKRNQKHNSSSVQLHAAHITNLLQSVRNMVYELIHDRQHTMVRVTHQDDSLMAFPKNYTGLFNLTKDQWGYEKSRHQSDHDWTNDFWITPVSSSELPATDLRKLGGYCSDTLETFLASRWGVNDIVRETASSISVTEGSYWPRGRPYSRDFAQQLASTSK